MSTGNYKSVIVTGLGKRLDVVPRDAVEDFQRARIISAMVEVAAEVGYLGAAVAPVVARAGVSRRTFYELFEGREECFLAAFEWGAWQMRSVMLDAYRSQRTWRESVRHALAALLVLLDSESQLARSCVIEALGAGKLVLAHRSQLLDELIAALDDIAPRSRGGVGAPVLTAQGIVGGAFSVIHGRLLELRIADSAEQRDKVNGSSRSGPTTAGSEGVRRTPGPLIELHGQLMGLIALPYLGPRAAGEELTRLPPDLPMPEVARARGDGGRLLERLDMRLTYRTVRCLTFIADHPGASNREIAKGADIPDEGQASKLLGRLVKLDLIANSKPHGPGYPNHWTLTPHGEQVLSAVHGR
jgi:AcrR family transcriptional regulator/DNA-binding MarR family transcriptional regulator